MESAMPKYSHLRTPKQIGQYMSENIKRIKKVISHMKNPVDRWNYIIDQTPETNWGVKMCDNLIEWAGKYLPGGIERPELDWEALKEMCGKIGNGGR